MNLIKSNQCYKNIHYKLKMIVFQIIVYESEKKCKIIIIIIVFFLFFFLE